MKKINVDQVKPYAAPAHFNMTALRLVGKDECGATKFWVGMSHFLPGGGAEMGANPFEKFYFVLEGEITCRTESEEITLKKGEGVFFGPNENRAILNRSNYPCTTLVIYNY